MVVFGEENVQGFYITMNYVLRMKIIKAQTNLNEDFPYEVLSEGFSILSFYITF